MSQLLAIRTNMKIFVSKRLLNLLEKDVIRTEVLKLKLDKFKLKKREHIFPNTECNVKFGKKPSGEAISCLP